MTAVSRSFVASGMPEFDCDNPPVKSLGRGRHHKRGLKFGLTLLRKALGLSQVEVAEKAKMTQSEISRIEKRDDRLVSTLQRYTEALGGQLRVYIDVNGHKYEVDLACKGPRIEREETSRRRPGRRRASR
jgi:hypothetical protein